MIIKNRDEVTSHGDLRGREIVADILEAGLAAIDPYPNIRRLVRVENGKLGLGGFPEMDLSGYGDEVIDLSRTGNIYVVDAGKTVQRQAKAIEDLLGDRLTAGTITITKGEEIIARKIEITEGAHPVPDEKSVEGTRKIVEIAGRVKGGDLVFSLFSSGSSSLFVLPLEGFTLEEIRSIYKLAIQYGDQIIIWRVMKYFSAVNSGRILMTIHPARAIHLLKQRSSREGVKPYLLTKWMVFCNLFLWPDRFA